MVKLTLPGELYAARKWKLFIIPQHDILKVLTGELSIVNFPKGAAFLDCGYRIDAQGFAILVGHDSYDVVPNSDTAPHIDIEYKIPKKCIWTKNKGDSWYTRGCDKYSLTYNVDMTAGGRCGNCGKFIKVSPITHGEG